MKTRRVVVFVCFLLIAMLVAPAVAAPPFAAQVSFAEADARAQREGKLLLQWSHAEWSRLCAAQEYGALADPAFVQWVNEHAVFWACDVDEKRSESVAAGVTAVPTISVFTPEGKGIRIVGVLGSDELLKVLEIFRRTGRNAGPPTADKAIVRGTADWIDQTDFVRTMEIGLKNRDFPETMGLIETYWPYMYDDLGPYGRAVRERAVPLLSILVDILPEGEQRARAMRARAFDRLKTDPFEPGAVACWAELDLSVLREGELAMKWFDRYKREPRAQRAIALMRERWVAAVMDRRSWVDLLLLEPEPIGAVRTGVPDTDGMRFGGKSYSEDGFGEDDPGKRRSRESYAREMLEKQRLFNAAWYVALQAAGEAQRAAELAEFVSERDPDPLAQLAVIGRVARAEGFGGETHDRWASLAFGD